MAAGLMKNGKIRNRFENISSEETVRKIRAIILRSRREEKD